jgi:hypothetical protein
MVKGGIAEALFKAMLMALSISLAVLILSRMTRWA